MNLEILLRQVTDLQAQVTTLTATVAADVERTKDVGERVKELKQELNNLILEGRPATRERLNALEADVETERQRVDALTKEGSPPLKARVTALEDTIKFTRQTRITLVASCSVVVLAVLGGIIHNELWQHSQDIGITALEAATVRQDTSMALVALSSVVSCAKAEENQKLILSTHRGAVVTLPISQSLTVSCDSIRTLLRKRLDGLAP